jgi:hypothetical protein
MEPNRAASSPDTCSRKRCDSKPLFLRICPETPIGPGFQRVLKKFDRGDRREDPGLKALFSCPYSGA